MFRKTKAMRLYFYIIFSILLFNGLSAQENAVLIENKESLKANRQHYLGFNYGNDVIGGGNFSSKFSDARFNSFGVKYQRKNSELASSIYVSEDFEGVTEENRKFRHLKTTVGSNVVVGDKFHLILGLGVIVKILVLEEGYSEEFKDLSLGLKFNTGFGCQVSSKILIDILCEFQHGFTPMYTENLMSSGGANYYVSERERQLFLEIGLHYLIKGKKN